MFPSGEERGIFKSLHVTLVFEFSVAWDGSLPALRFGRALRLNKLESLNFSATEFLLFLGSSTVIMLPIELNLLEQRTCSLELRFPLLVCFKFKGKYKSYSFFLKSNSKRATAVWSFSSSISNLVLQISLLLLSRYGLVASLSVLSNLNPNTDDSCAFFVMAKLETVTFRMPPWRKPNTLMGMLLRVSS